MVALQKPVSSALASKLRTNLTLISFLAVSLASGIWATGLDSEITPNNPVPVEVVLVGLFGAMILAFLLGTSLRGPWGALINLNRLIAWPMAFGYVWVHYAFHMHHGNPGGLAALQTVPRVFFIVSFVWIAFHAGVAVKVYGAPWSLKLRTVHDWYIALSWMVLIVTIPVFSIPALGANPLLMTIAWLFFAPHISMNMYNLLGRVPNSLVSSNVGRFAGTSVYAAFIVVAAINSFPVI
ncbi:MAG: hypothetical protein K9G02_01545 [Microbacteriaceae bacterium]|nr:hypothetical protein [Microbacteriaceae bacterium]